MLHGYLQGGEWCLPDTHAQQSKRVERRHIRRQTAWNRLSPMRHLELPTTWPYKLLVVIMVFVPAIPGSLALVGLLIGGSYVDQRAALVKEDFQKNRAHSNSLFNKVNSHLKMGEYRLAYATYQEFKAHWEDHFKLTPEAKAEMAEHLAKLKANYIAEGIKDGTVSKETLSGGVGGIGVEYSFYIDKKTNKAIV